MKILWYEDLTTNFEEEVRGLSKFTGYELSDENMKVNLKMLLNQSSVNFYDRNL